MKFILAFVICVTIKGIQSEVSTHWPCDRAYQFFEVQSNCSTLIYIDLNPGETFADWATYTCQSSAVAYRSCVQTAFSVCDSSLRADVMTWTEEYFGRICDGNSPHPFVLDTLQTMQSVLGMDSCAQFAEWGTCDWMDFNVMLHPEVNDTMSQLRPKFNRRYESLLRCVNRQMRFTTSCSAAERSAYMYYMILAAVPMGVYIDMDLIRNTNTTVDAPREGKRYTVGAYGDPHLRPYKSPPITCSSPGWMEYLTNDFITINANNTLLWEGWDATVITRVQVLLRDRTGEQKAEYIAENGFLPPSFVSGRSEVEIDGSTAFVNSHRDTSVLILHPESGSIISINRNGVIYNALVVRSSEALFDDSTGMFVDGCFDSINIESDKRRRKRAAIDCESVCAGEPENFKSTCEFDCHVTGDVAFATSSSVAVTEAETFVMDADEELSDPVGTRDGSGNEGGSGSQGLRGVSALICFTLLTSLMYLW